MLWWMADSGLRPKLRAVPRVAVRWCCVVYTDYSESWLINSRECFLTERCFALSTPWEHIFFLSCSLGIALFNDISLFYKFSYPTTQSSDEPSELIWGPGHSVVFWARMSLRGPFVTFHSPPSHRFARLLFVILRLFGFNILCTCDTQ